jgi:Skp family chaperone for outer membrane proteins
LIISRIWQRLISKSVLSLQLTNLLDNKQLLPEVLTEFKTVKEFQMLSNSIKGVIKDFKKISNSTYDLVLERDKGAYEVQARINIP